MKKNVLIIEDEIVTAEAVKEALALDDISADIASDGKTGLEKFMSAASSRTSRYRLKSSTMEKALRMSARQRSRFIRPGRNWSVPAWALHLWRHLWMMSRWIPHRDRARRYAW